MRRSVSNEIRKKAHFVAGRDAWFRPESDPQAKSAVHDVEAFLAHLPRHIPAPTINAGTTSQPERIVTLTWVFGGYTSIRSVFVSFKGNSECDVLWEDVDGQRFEELNVSVAELDRFDIPSKIETLIKNARPTADQADSLDP